MVTLVGRNFLIRPRIDVGTDIVTVQLTLDSEPTTFSLSKAPIKYNKVGTLHLEWDDGYPQITNVAEIIGAHSHTDGCGNNIAYRGAVAVNGHAEWQGNYTEVGGPQGSALKYADFTPLIAAGFDIENHSDLHLQLANLADTKADLMVLNKLVYDRTGYVMNTIVQPTNFEYYTRAGDELGFLAITNQGANDGYPSYPDSTNYSNPEILRYTTDLTTIPAGYAQLFRSFATGDWNQSDANTHIAMFNNYMTYVNSGTHQIMRVGSHGHSQAPLESFLSHVNTQANDKLVVCSMRETFEYKYLYDTVPFQHSVNGTTVTITYDLSQVPSHFRWTDLSFVVNSDAAVVNATVTGASNTTFSSNLINVFNEKLSWNTHVLN